METPLWIGIFVLGVLNIAQMTFSAFFKGYGTKKGENLATKEDIAELTRITKDIELQISSRAWHRDLKKEISFDLLKKLWAIDYALERLGTAHDIDDIFHPAIKNIFGAVTKEEAMKEFLPKFEAFDEALALASVVCGPDVGKVCKELDELSFEILYAILSPTKATAKQYIAFTDKCEELAALVRTDLGL